MPDARELRRQYWRANIRLVLVMLLIWFAISYGCGIFGVQYLNQFRLGGFPLGFWFAQQGSIYVFILLVFVYSRLMDKLDKKYGVSEDEV